MIHVLIILFWLDLWLLHTSINIIVLGQQRGQINCKCSSDTVTTLMEWYTYIGNIFVAILWSLTNSSSSSPMTVSTHSISHQVLSTKDYLVFTISWTCILLVISAVVMVFFSPLIPIQIRSVILKDGRVLKWKTTMMTLFLSLCTDHNQITTTVVKRSIPFSVTTKANCHHSIYEYHLV